MARAASAARTTHNASAGPPANSLKFSIFSTALARRGTCNFPQPRSPMRRPCHVARSSPSRPVQRGDERSSSQLGIGGAPSEEAQLPFYPSAPVKERAGPDQGRSRRSRRHRGRAGELDTEPLLTPGQILDLANTSMRSFRRWTASGELEVVRLGRSIRVRRSVWAAFLHKRSPQS